MLTRSFRKKRKLDAEFSLQITSLADILIIVLVFLLNTFSFDLRGATEFSIPKEIRLPAAAKSGAIDAGLEILVSEKAVSLTNKKVVSLTGYRFDASDLRQDFPNSRSSVRLNAVFAAEKLRHSSSRPILILADRRAPYSTIQTIVASAALNGFTNVKFAVVAKK